MRRRSENGKGKVKGEDERRAYAGATLSPLSGDFWYVDKRYYRRRAAILRIHDQADGVNPHATTYPHTRILAIHPRDGG